MKTGSSPDHLNAAAALYGVTADDLRPLGAFESDVYAFEGAAGPAILKVIAPEHRTPDMVRAEVDWLLALLEAGVSVAEPLASTTGEWVERLPGSELSGTPTDTVGVGRTPASGHVLVAFKRSPGATTRPGDWTDEHLEDWGSLLGRLQAHSRGWLPPGPRRHALADQSYLTGLAQFEAVDPEFAASASLLIERAQPLLAATPGADGGLLHADLHHGNLLLHEGRFTAIDFDDCAYGSYAFDIAMPLYYAVRGQRAEDPGVVAERFLGPFLRGFSREAPLPAGGADAVDTCLRFRMAELVMALRQKLPPEKRTEQVRRMERDLRDRVVAGAEVVPRAVLERFFGG